MTPNLSLTTTMVDLSRNEIDHVLLGMQSNMPVNKQEDGLNKLLEDGTEPENEFQGRSIICFASAATSAVAQVAFAVTAAFAVALFAAPAQSAADAAVLSVVQVAAVVPVDKLQCQKVAPVASSVQAQRLRRQSKISRESGFSF